MSSILPSDTMNPHVASLEKVFADSPRPIQWLVVAHNDAQMLQSLSAALANESAAILEVSQDTWDFQGKLLPEAIEWALEQSEIRNIVLVGDSQAGGPESRATLVSSNSDDDLQPGFAKMIAGVQRYNAHNGEAPQRFAKQVRQLSQMPALHHRWSSGELNIHGLFYRADSGVFLAYNADEDTFQPLLK